MNVVVVFCLLVAMSKIKMTASVQKRNQNTQEFKFGKFQKKVCKFSAYIAFDKATNRPKNNNIHILTSVFCFLKVIKNPPIEYSTSTVRDYLYL